MIPEAGTPQEFKRALLALGVKCYVCEQWCLVVDYVGFDHPPRGWSFPSPLPLCLSCSQKIQRGYNLSGTHTGRVRSMVRTP